MYVKMFNSILNSSLMDEDPLTQLIFMKLLALADDEGFIAGTVGSLARRLCHSKEQIEAALAALNEPDPESGTPDEEGRRVIQIKSQLWHIVNYLKYREIARAEDRKRQNREAQRRHRAGTAKSEGGVSNGQHPSAPVINSKPSEAEAEAEAEAEEDTHPDGGVGRKSRKKDERIDLVWDAYLIALNKTARFKLTPERRRWIRERLADFTVEEIKQAIVNFANDDWEGRKKFNGPEYIFKKHSQLEKWALAPTKEERNNDEYRALRAGVESVRGPKR